MHSIVQKQDLTRARLVERQTAAAQQASHIRRLQSMRQISRCQVLLVEAGMSFVRLGGNGLHDLREDIFDVAHNTNGRVGLFGIGEVYASAMMGGEPYAVWN